MIKGDAKLLRIKDTGTSGQEWAIRSDGGNFQILYNNGSEGSPSWLIYLTVTTAGVTGTTLVTPTITNFGNANHNHSNSVGGGVSLYTGPGIKNVKANLENT